MTDPVQIAPHVGDLAYGMSLRMVATLAVIAAHEGFELRPPAADDRESPLFDRLGRFANATGFRFREIALEANWWKQEGPPILAIETAGGRPPWRFCSRPAERCRRAALAPARSRSSSRRAQ